MNNINREDTATLEILQAINEKEDVTQRHLSKRLGVALGLTNSYLKRCVRKGLIKVKHTPANRYLYYLTPKGFTEKSRLTTKYLSASFDTYRTASNSYNAVFTRAGESNYEKLLFCGVSELAEIASIRLIDFKLAHVATYDKATTTNYFLGKPVIQQIESANNYDACVVTEFVETKRICEQLNLIFPEERILVPDFLS